MWNSAREYPCFPGKKQPEPEPKQFTAATASTHGAGRALGTGPHSPLLLPGFKRTEPVQTRHVRCSSSAGLFDLTSRDTRSHSGVTDQSRDGGVGGGISGSEPDQLLRHDSVALLTRPNRTELPAADMSGQRRGKTLIITDGESFGPVLI